MTQQNSPTCPTCEQAFDILRTLETDWPYGNLAMLRSFITKAYHFGHREPAAPPKSVQRHATETALDFKGEIEFLEDLENKRGIFASPPEGETNGTRTHVQTNNGPIRTRTDSTLPDPQRGAIASPAMSTARLTGMSAAELEAEWLAQSEHLDYRNWLQVKVIYLRGEVARLTRELHDLCHASRPMREMTQRAKQAEAEFARLREQCVEANKVINVACQELKGYNARFTNQLISYDKKYAWNARAALESTTPQPARFGYLEPDDVTPQEEK